MKFSLTFAAGEIQSSRVSSSNPEKSSAGSEAFWNVNVTSWFGAQAVSTALGMLDQLGPSLKDMVTDIHSLQEGEE